MKKRMSLYTWMIVGNFIFPFMNVLFPYLYWRQNRQTEDTAFTKEACNLLNFQILFSFIMIGVFVFGGIVQLYIGVWVKLEVGILSNVHLCFGWR